MKRTLTGVCIAGLAVLLGAGCVAFNRTNLQYTRTTTIGQELEDLKAALDGGAITQDEYESTRKILLRGGPAPMPPAQPAE